MGKDAQRTVSPEGLFPAENSLAMYAMVATTVPVGPSHLSLLPGTCEIASYDDIRMLESRRTSARRHGVEMPLGAVAFQASNAGPKFPSCSQALPD